MNATRRQKKSRAPRTRRRPHARGSSAVSPTYVAPIYRGLSDMIPASSTVTLRYTDPTVSRMQAAVLWTLFGLRANDAWDPDPAFASGAVSGFREYATFYAKWRVLGLQVDWDVVNQTNAPIVVYINCPSDVNIIPSNYAAAVSFGDNPTSTRPVTLTQSSTGQSKARIRFRVDFSKLYGGGGEYIANETFVGNGGLSPTSPGTRTFLNFVGYSSANMTTGIFSRLTIKYNVHFFDRYPLVT